MGDIRCAACGAAVPAAIGPTHPYLPADPGCWALYTGLLGDPTVAATRSPATTVDLVDAYAAQHATDPDRRNRQSVAVHLMSLCTGLERGAGATRRRALLGTWTHRDYPELLPRPRRFPVTVRDVADAAPDRRAGVVSTMATATWTAWADHHATVRSWLDAPPDRTPRRPTRSGRLSP